MEYQYTKKDYYRNLIASDKLKDSIYDKISDTDPVIGFAYTDYGGDMFDKVCIEYFSENYPDNFVWEDTGWNGKNGILFGEVVERFMESTKSYLLGFEDIEDLYYTMERETEHESFIYFLKDLKHDYTFDHDKCLSWLIDNKSGHYTVYPWGLDYSHEDFEKSLIEENLIVKKKE